MLELVERVAHPSNREENSVSAMNKDWSEEAWKHQRVALSWVGGSGNEALFLASLTTQSRPGLCSEANFPDTVLTAGYLPCEFG